jgi:hypothetical protein
VCTTHRLSLQCCTRCYPLILQDLDISGTLVVTAIDPELSRYFRCKPAGL